MELFRSDTESQTGVQLFELSKTSTHATHRRFIHAVEEHVPLEIVDGLDGHFVVVVFLWRARMQQLRARSRDWRSTFFGLEQERSFS